MHVPIDHGGTAKPMVGPRPQDGERDIGKDAKAAAMIRLGMMSGGPDTCISVGHFAADDRIGRGDAPADCQLGNVQPARGDRRHLANRSAIAFV